MLVRCYRLLLALAAACLIAGQVVPVQAAHERPIYLAQAQGQKARAQSSKITAREAAARARQQYGGKVLKVTPSGRNYRVRLLQDSGRVITVTIRG